MDWHVLITVNSLDRISLFIVMIDASSMVVFVDPVTVNFMGVFPVLTMTIYE